MASLALSSISLHKVNTGSSHFVRNSKSFCFTGPNHGIRRVGIKNWEKCRVVMNDSVGSSKAIEDLVFSDYKATTAFLFPGQGAQAIGMGREAQNVPAAADLYKKANDILGFDLLDVCLNGPKEKLDSTIISQPAIYVTSLAAVELLRVRDGGQQIIDSVDVTCGLSLGEYTALAFAGAFSFEDGLIFAGFNSTLREGNVTHHEYIQVGKGRDVGLNQISQFEAKIANGNGEQTLSRDIYRLGHRFDFFRMLSCYFTTVGSYISTLITVLTVYVFLYGRLYLVLSGLEKALSDQPGIQDNKPLQVALASQSFVQIGFLMALPMLMEIGLERGFRTALSEFVLMQLQLAPVFFTFSLGTKTHYYGRTLLHGDAKYRPTGRGFVVFHAKFADNYRLYSRSHFVKGLELMILLIVYQIFGQSYRSALAYVFITISMWFMVGTWLFAPFLFNPSGFEWQKIVDDWSDWNKWIDNRGGIGVPPEKSWESWWEQEQAHLHHSGKRGIAAEILLALRFFIYQYGLVYHLTFTKNTKSFWVYGISWLVIFLMLFVMKAVSVGRRKFSANFQLMFRLIKGLIFLTFISILVTLIVLPHMTFQDIVVCIISFMPTGWGLLLIAQACKPLVYRAGFWGSVKTLARGYEIVMGLFLFTPVAFLAWFPFVSEFQTRMLFNQAFSRGLQISRILGGHRKDRTRKD